MSHRCFRAYVLILTSVSLLVLALASPAQAQRYDLPSRPAGPVLDQGSMLSSTEEERLARKLTAFTDTTSTAIVVVTVRSLEGAPIADYAVALGREWGVGQEGKDNGVVMLVSRGDRQMFIATGYGVEGALPDAIANRIVERVITPYFREGQFYAGIDRGTDAIIQATKGEYEATASSRPASSDDGMPMALIFTLLVLAYFVITSFRGGGGRGKKGRRSSRRGGDFPIIFWGGGGHGGGGGFSGGGGGFGGFGGGCFGGGGAGGSW